MNRCKAGFLAAFFPTRFERFPPLPPALPALVRFTNSPPQHRVSLTRGALINPGLCTSQAAGLRRRLLCPSNTKTTTARNRSRPSLALNERQDPSALPSGPAPEYLRRWARVPATPQQRRVYGRGRALWLAGCHSRADGERHAGGIWQLGPADSWMPHSESARAFYYPPLPWRGAE